MSHKAGAVRLPPSTCLSLGLGNELFLGFARETKAKPGLFPYLERGPMIGWFLCSPRGRSSTVSFAIAGMDIWIPKDIHGESCAGTSGNNDGTKAGERYFSCKGDRYGCFARPENAARLVTSREFKEKPMENQQDTKRVAGLDSSTRAQRRRRMMCGHS